MTFEKWLSGIIKGKSINLSELARKTGVPYYAINRSLNGMRNLRPDELIAICRYVGVNPMDCEGEGGEKDGGLCG